VTQARALREVRARTAHRVGNARIDLILHRSIAGPAGRHPHLPAIVENAPGTTAEANPTS
jgi:hypothetical protein